VDAAVSRFRFFERMRDCRDRVAKHARLGNAFGHALAFLLISQILNEMSYFHCRTADHDPKSKVDFPTRTPASRSPFRLFLSGVVESITKQSRKSTAGELTRRYTGRLIPDQWHPSPLKRLDEWRRKEDDLPSRPEAIRGHPIGVQAT
jgi:hypothetical protein